MGVGEAFYVGQFAIGRRIVIDRVLGREILLVLCDRAFLDLIVKANGFMPGWAILRLICVIRLSLIR